MMNRLAIMEDFDFSAHTGKGVKVAVVDSGIDTAHPDIGEVKGGVSVRLDKAGRIAFGQDWFDSVGHGTACAGIIRKKAPNVRFYSVKIFDDESLSAKGEVLIEAIRWCLAQGMNVVNLSLGTTERQLLPSLREVCDHAEQEGVLLVSAEHNEGRESFPACFPNVFGVTAGQVYGKYAYLYREHHPIGFVARGDPQRLCWVRPRYVFMAGTSFAAPQMTALIALILEQYPNADFHQVKQILMADSSRERSRPVSNLTKSTQARIRNSKELPHPTPGQLDWIKKAAIYPFNREMHALIRFRDLLNFEIVGVGDPIGKRLVGKDAGEAIGAEPIGLKIAHKLERILADADTFILGYVDQLGRSLRRDPFREILQKALALGRHIYSLAPINPSAYPEIFKIAESKGLKIAFPFVSSEELREIPPDQLSSPKSIDIPVVGVFGTGPQQGKFTTQLALRRILLAQGYRIAQLGSEHQSELFGFDLTFPYGYAYSVWLPMDAYIAYLDYKIWEISQRRRPDIMIVGAQLGTVPYDFSLSPQTNYTLPSLAFLFGTKPDAYILTVNSIDPDEYIQHSINALKALGKGETILLTMSDKEKDIRSAYGTSRVVPRQISPEELRAKLDHLEDRFGIPATEVISSQGQEKLARAVVEYFGVEQEGENANRTFDRRSN
jgi:uncharacterized NAD-dependent epimerase/dehydratase family protein